MELAPEIATESPPSAPTRGLRVAAALATFWFSAAIGCVAVRRWRRAAFWIVTDWTWVGVYILAVHLTRPRLMWAGLAGYWLWRIPAAIDAFRLVGKAREYAAWKTLVRAWITLTLGSLAVLSGIVRPFLVEAFQMPTVSMLPTLVRGDRIIADKTARVPARGDVIVFEFPLDRSADYLKRVVALGGDVVEMDDSGQLSINGQQVPRERVQNGCPEGVDVERGVPCVIWEETLDGRRYQVGLEENGPSRGHERKVVPPGSVFVLGDNRDNSSDSRVWGFVPLENVKGTVRFIWWSIGPTGTRWERLNALVP